MQVASSTLYRVSRALKLIFILFINQRLAWKSTQAARSVTNIQRVLKNDIRKIKSGEDLSTFYVETLCDNYSDVKNIQSVTKKIDQSVRLIGDNITRSIGHIALGFAQRYLIKELGLGNSYYLTLAQEFGNKHLYKEYWSFLSPEVGNTPSLTKLISNLSPNIWEDISQVSLKGAVLKCNEATSTLFYEWFVTRNHQSILHLTPRDRENGESWLRRNGIKESDWYVVIHNRWTNEGTWNPRNNRLQDYIPGIKYILAQGGFVIKGGLPDGQIINNMGNRYIDYSNSQSRCEELDVFLYGSCRYMLACSSGPAFVAANFGVPQLTLNVTDLGAMPFIPNSIAVPKMRIEKNSNRKKKFNEELHLGVYDTDNLAEEFLLHYEFRNNSPNEIKSAIVEFHQLVEMNKLEEINTQESRMQELISARTKCPTTKIAESFLEKHYEYFF